MKFLQVIWHTAKYGIKGSRLSSIKNVFNTLEPYIHDKICILKSICDVLPIDENIEFVEKDGNEFYKVNEKYFQLTNTAEYVYENLKKIYDSYGHRAKQAEQNDGVDWKAISHALRAGYQARDIFTKGDFEYPLKETDFLLAVKQGKLDFKTEVSPVLEELVKTVQNLSDFSVLPEKVDSDRWDKWLLDIYYYNFNMVIKNFH